MAIFRITKDKNYSVISNLYLRNKNLSLKAIGLFTIILSLPPDFDYSIGNIQKLTKESYRTIKLLLNELKINGYLVISKKRNDKGLYNYEYIFFESYTLNPTFNSILNNSPEVKNYTMDNINNYNNYNTFDTNPEVDYPVVVKEPLYNISTNDNKINIDKTKLNLCFLTEELIDMNFIKLNSIDLFSYDYFLRELLNTEDYKDLICVFRYVTNTIIKNRFKDENSKPILNVLTYFKSSVLTNLSTLKTRRDTHLFDEWLD